MKYIMLFYSLLLFQLLKPMEQNSDDATQSAYQKRKEKLLQEAELIAQENSEVFFECFAHPFPQNLKDTQARQVACNNLSDRLEMLQKQQSSHSYSLSTKRTYIEIKLLETQRKKLQAEEGFFAYPSPSSGFGMGIGYSFMSYHITAPYIPIFRDEPSYQNPKLNIVKEILHNEEDYTFVAEQELTWLNEVEKIKRKRRATLHVWNERRRQRIPPLAIAAFLNEVQCQNSKKPCVNSEDFIELRKEKPELN